MATRPQYDNNLNNEKYIHFRKTDSSTFASQFPEFRTWLYKTNDNLEFVNIIGSRNIPVLDASNNLQLNPDREKLLPILYQGDIYNMYFLDDIKVIYINGVPYTSPDDYITDIKFHDGDEIYKDPSTHVIYIPVIAGGGSGGSIDMSKFKISRLAFKDSNGLTPVGRMIPFYSTAENTYTIESVYNSYRLNGIEGSNYALTSNIVGNATDNLDSVLTLNALKNYVLTHGGGGGGGDYDDTWHSDEEED